MFIRSSIALTVVLFSISASAQSVDVMERCEGYASVAGSIMQERQAGAKMSELMRSAEDMGSLSDITKSLVVKAYKAPPFNTKKHQDRAISKFENDAYLYCITALKEK